MSGEEVNIFTLQKKNLECNNVSSKRAREIDSKRAKNKKLAINIETQVNIGRSKKNYTQQNMLID